MSRMVLDVSENLRGKSFAENYTYEKARNVLLSKEAYAALQESLPGVNDDHSIRMLVDYLRGEW